MNTRQSKGIQMIGTQRSGSNLLRVMLDQSDEIASPHPPHLLVTFVPLLDQYRGHSGYRRLVSDVVDFVEANPVPWDGVSLDKKALFEASFEGTLFELNRLVYEQAASAKSARYWCCKSMANVHYAEQLEAANAIDKYLYLYRDGRDVAASFRKAIVGDKHLYFLAKQWAEDQEACLSLRKKIPAERFFALSYEELIASPEPTVRALCRFLEIPFSEKMLEFHSSHTSRITAEAGAMWKNLNKPILTQNSGKFLKSFSTEECELFELIAGETLRKLGYPLYTDRSDTRLTAPEMVAAYQIENSLLKAQVLANAPANDLVRRKPQQMILDRIKKQQTSLKQLAVK